ncbi:DUF6624 domain-containing protein [Sphingobium sp. TCM1]|uniref:DUF6624 domain-containing protein n=1 Tax=Sphingobium sp. TCM1 TaxID=453246 RepID=UPI0007F43089|nr:DUF6624 domain-containing protein [Sphingobium sp. TCM1]OAN51867.1 hypothetical protein A7Q26_09240 [Sphingobium sp. TCM1]
MWAFQFSMQAALATINPSPTLNDFQNHIKKAYEVAEAEQARKPPAQNISEKLIRLGILDQTGRMAFQHLDFSSVPESERQAWRMAIFSEISRHDIKYQDELVKLIPEDGWFKISIYGKEAARSAFLIVQHATNNVTLMRQVLKKLGELWPSGEAEGQLYALMYDRVSLEFDKKPQLYGTQVKCNAGHWEAYNLEDKNHVNARRTSVGMKQTLEEYLSTFDDSKCDK